MFHKQTPLRASMPSVEAAQLAQEQVRVLARVVYVAHGGRAAQLARVVYHDVAVAEEPLEDGRRDGHVLYVPQGQVARRACDEALVNLYLVVRQRVFNHVALDVIVSRDEQQRERKRD